MAGYMSHSHAGDSDIYWSPTFYFLYDCAPAPWCSVISQLCSCFM